MGLFGSAGRWQGLCASLLTPFDTEGVVDHAVYSRQLEFLLRHGAHAVCPGMHAGESPSLSLDERRMLIDLTIDMVDGRVPVAAHVGCAGTAHTTQLAQHAQRAGAQAVVVVTPYYWHPPEDALFEHLVTVAESIDIDLIAYFYPGDATPRLVERLIERSPNFQGIKTADLDMTAFTELCATTRATRPDLSILAGLEYLTPTNAVGGAGGFSILSTVAPRLVANLWKAIQSGDTSRAIELQQSVSRLWHALHARFPAGIKAGAELMGRALGEPRMPLIPFSATERAALAHDLETLGLTATEPYGWDTDGRRPDPVDSAMAASR